MFSVYYYSNAKLGSQCECECRNVDMEEAAQWFMHHTHNVAARTGFTVRVIMTDEMDCCIAEWRYGEGIVHPKPARDYGRGI
jgi:hypothetical protein